jgi:hypothetical protein
VDPDFSSGAPKSGKMIAKMHKPFDSDYPKRISEISIVIMKREGNFSWLSFSDKIGIECSTFYSVGLLSFHRVYSLGLS